MWATSLHLLCVLFFFTMVSHGVDTMRFPCSALNVKVVRNWKQARTNDMSNHDSDNGSHDVTDSSNHSLYLMKLLSSSCPDGTLYVIVVQNKRG